MKSLKNSKELIDKKLKNKFKIFNNNNINYKGSQINLNIYNNLYFKNRNNNNIQIYSYYNNNQNPEIQNTFKTNKIKSRNSLKNKIFQSMNETNKKSKISNKTNIYDNKQIIKNKLKIKIEKINKNRIILENNLKLKNQKLLVIKLENERKNNENKILNLKEQYNFIIEKYKIKIKSLKKKLIKCKKDYIKKEKLEENLKKENLDFQNNKIKLLNELIEYRGLLSNISISKDDNSEAYSNIKDYSSDENTIIENSYG